MMYYIMQAGCMIGGCLVFYKLLLQRETFFRLNRVILITCLLLAFSLPLLRVPQQWSFRKAPEPVPAISTTLPEYMAEPAVQTPQPVVTAPVPEKQTRITMQQVLTWAGWLYWFGAAVFGFNFLVQIGILLFRAYTRPVIKDGRFRIVELAGDKAPCSFGNIIFINPEKYDWDTYNQILLHEKVHIQQGHSFDILLAEIVLIFQWFNPFAWLYRKELENNLEFLTDDQLLHTGHVEKTSYQLSLLKVSAPHFPLSLTTNYNQSLLKKRIAMMNVKKSNVHTTWKYFFLCPLLLLFICLFNEPVANAQHDANKDNLHQQQRDKDEKFGLPTQGYWFAIIKDEKLELQLKDDQDGHSNSTNSFKVSDFGPLPRDKEGTFSLTRDAGTLQFTGKFDGDQGMGRYKFNPDASFAADMKKEGVDVASDNDQLTFFMVNVTRAYVKMLKDNGYTSLSKHDLIPLAALKVDGAYIESLKKSGLKELPLHDLIPLKALKIDADYVAEIRKAGYPNVTVRQLISFKSQHIDGKYIADVVAAARSENRELPEGKDRVERKEKAEQKERPEQRERPERNENSNGSVNPNDLIALKSLHIDAAYIQSLKEVGYDHLSSHELIALKAQDITADYIRQLQSAGYKDISAHQLIGIKANHITPEYLKSFESVGYPTLDIREAIPLKSLDVTADFIKGFQSIGYKDITPHKAISLKAQKITPSLVQEYKALGFDELSLNDVISAKATGTTPSFISSMKEKGHNFNRINKYVQLKSILNEKD